MAAQPHAPLSEAEYLTIERDSDVRHEFHQGQMVAMAGMSERHSAIIASTQFRLYGQLRGGPCRVYTTDVRVRITTTELYAYPDLLIVCGNRQFADDQRDTLLNPTVIIEVLSPPTEGYDRGRKFLHYQKIPSLREYLLIAQEVPVVEQFVRQDDGRWLYSAASELGDLLHLDAINCILPLADIYELVNWDK
jgi:Uma2 family endonuclease